VIYAVTKRPVGFIEDRYELKLQLFNNIVCEMQIPSYIKIRSLVPETSQAHSELQKTSILWLSSFSIEKYSYIYI